MGNRWDRSIENGRHWLRSIVSDNIHNVFVLLSHNVFVSSLHPDFLLRRSSGVVMMAFRLGSLLSSSGLFSS